MLASSSAPNLCSYDVADFMPVAIVDRLEVIDIEHDGGNGRRKTLGAVEQCTPVGQAGEDVGLGIALVAPCVAHLIEIQATARPWTRCSGERRRRD